MIVSLPRLMKPGRLLFRWLLLLVLGPVSLPVYGQVTVSGRQISNSINAVSNLSTNMTPPLFRPDGGYCLVVHSGDTLQVDNTRLVPRAQTNILLIKEGYLLTFTPNGRLRRVFRPGLHTGARFTAGATDSVGNVYMLGDFYGQISLGSFTLQASNTAVPEGVLCKVDSAGQVQWARALGAATGEAGALPFTSRLLTGLRVDGAGNTYLAGVFWRQTTLGGQTLQSVGDYDIVVAKYSAAGQPLWVQRVGSTGPDTFVDLAVDRAGRAYLGFDFDSGITLGSTVYNPRGRDAAVLRFSPTGTMQWAQVMNTTGTDRLSNLVVDASGQYLYTSLRTSVANSIWGTAVLANTSYIVRLNPGTGAPRWMSATQVGLGGGWDVDRNGNLYTGSSSFYNQTVAYGNGVTVPAQPQPVPQVIMHSPDGLPQWYHLAALRPPLPTAFNGYYTPASLSLAPNGDVCAVQQGSPLLLGPDTLKQTFRSNRSIWSIWRLRPPLVAAGPALIRACPGAGFDLPFVVSNAALTAANVFTAQLSDSLGRFDAPVTVGTNTSATSGTITVTLPATLPPGRHYRLRVQASAPRALLSAGPGTEVHVTVHPYVRALASGPLSHCAGTPAPVLQGEAGVNTTLQWLRDGQPIGGATTATHTPTQSGSYALQATGSCGTSVSAALSYTVNPLPAVTLAPLAPVLLGHAPFALTGGTPAGGTYSGPGVSAGAFDPQAAGLGAHNITYSYTDANGCQASATTTQEVRLTLPTRASRQAGLWSVYPNPTAGIIYLRWSGRPAVAQLQAVNAIGQVVLTQQLNLSETAQAVDFHQLPAGLYQLILQVPGAVLSQPLQLLP